MGHPPHRGILFWLYLGITQQKTLHVTVIKMCTQKSIKKKLTWNFNFCFLNLFSTSLCNINFFFFLKSAYKLFLPEGKPIEEILFQHAYLLCTDTHECMLSFSQFIHYSFSLKNTCHKQFKIQNQEFLSNALNRIC